MRDIHRSSLLAKVVSLAYNTHCMLTHNVRILNLQRDCLLYLAFADVVFVLSEAVSYLRVTNIIALLWLRVH